MSEDKLKMYRVASGASLRSLEDEVNKLTELGYVPHGILFVRNKFYQPMIRMVAIVMDEDFESVEC